MLPVLGKKAVLEWCMEGLIGLSYVCPKCGKSMEIRTGKKVNDYFCNGTAKIQSSVKKDTHHVLRSVKKWFWIELSNMDLCTVLVMQK
ncbi:hypothetical protein TNCV_2659381 [Trichonephila clavipes]|uniref:Uncharacterized protein n=1 Tax=Trichonephila clavipes TaxID=2585209 RepID=A0A8X6RFF4_TRICX|nr:hypothetical protein TNCV_2659381 [Trichonephila clavipes]